MFTLILLAGCFSVHAQYQQVMFNYERSIFNDGQPLSAETYFIITGGISKNVTQVSVEFFSKNIKTSSTPLFFQKEQAKQVDGEKSTLDEHLKLKNKHQKGLEVRIHSEKFHILYSGLSVIGDIKSIDNYSVEKVKTIFTFHGRYGVVPLSNDITSSNFGSAPMVGMTSATVLCFTQTNGTISVLP